MFESIMLATPSAGIATPLAQTAGQSGGNIILDAAVFVIGVGVLGGLLFWITKRILIDEKY